MEFLFSLFLEPFLAMGARPDFFGQVFIGGLLTGVMYALVALGFVLIYKASGVFNFAQGAMVLFAALAMSRFAEWIPQWLGFESLLLANLLAFVAAMAVMIMLAWAIERLCLSKLVNQEGITLLMASARRCSAATSTTSTSACPRIRPSSSRACSRAA